MTKGEVQTIDIQPTGVCVFATSDGSVLRKIGVSVPGRWFLTLKEIIIDIKDYREPNYCIYRGYFDKQDNLIVERGVIYPQGSFHLMIARPTVFKKVY